MRHSDHGWFSTESLSQLNSIAEQQEKELTALKARPALIIRLRIWSFFSD